MKATTQIGKKKNYGTRMFESRRQLYFSMLVISASIYLLV